MRNLTAIVATLVLVLAPVSSYALFGDKDSPAKRRNELQDARDAALAKLYQEKPEAKAEIMASRGYAVFSNLGINVILLSTGSGGGILRDNRSGDDIYMKMFSAGGGWGVGVKDFSAIFIFETDKALDQFMTEGWDFSGQADANLESESKGAGAEAAMTAMPGTKVYQLTNAGVALQVTLQGTKYWVDEELN